MRPRIRYEVGHLRSLRPAEGSCALPLGYAEDSPKLEAILKGNPRLTGTGRPNFAVGALLWQTQS